MSFAKIIEKERDDIARKTKEAVHIRILPNMNRQEGRFHQSTYMMTSLVLLRAPKEGELTIFMSQLIIL